MSDKLKPCPFCGGEAHIDTSTSLRDYVVYCEGCDTYFALDAYSATEHDLVAAWNRRLGNEI